MEPRTWAFVIVVALLLATVRLPWLGNRVRIKVAEPGSGFDANWTREAALDATIARSLEGPADILGRHGSPAHDASIGILPSCTRHRSIA